MTTWIISNENLNYFIKIVKSLEDAGLLIKGVVETVEDEVKRQKRSFMNMLAATLAETFTGKYVSR